MENIKEQPYFKAIDWDSKFIPVCKTIIKSLQDRDLAFLHAHYWQGRSEKEIAPVIGLKNEDSVPAFKNRVFARCRMYTVKRAAFIPPCLQKELSSYSHTLYNLAVRLRRADIIEHVENDEVFRNTIKYLIIELKKYISVQDCTECRHNGKCQDTLKKHNKKCKTIHKILDINDYTLEKNLENHKKLLEYLLSWRVFDASC